MSLIGFGYQDKEVKEDFSFVPHSMAAGGLIAPKDSNIINDVDLKNKKIGIAGGQVDKGWLIFRAFYKKKYGEDLIKLSKPIFGAPLFLIKKLSKKTLMQFLPTGLTKQNF